VRAVGGTITRRQRHLPHVIAAARKRPQPEAAVAGPWREGMPSRERCPTPAPTASSGDVAARTTPIRGDQPTSRPDRSPVRRPGGGSPSARGRRWSSWRGPCPARRLGPGVARDSTSWPRPSEARAIWRRSRSDEATDGCGTDTVAAQGDACLISQGSVEWRGFGMAEPAKARPQAFSASRSGLEPRGRTWLSSAGDCRWTATPVRKPQRPVARGRPAYESARRQPALRPHGQRLLAALRRNQDARPARNRKPNTPCSGSTATGMGVIGLAGKPMATSSSCAAGEKSKTRSTARWNQPTSRRARLAGPGSPLNVAMRSGRSV
jgi:hypothetical protein